MLRVVLSVLDMNVRHIVAICIKRIARPIDWGLRFRMGIILGTISILFQFSGFSVSVFRGVSGTAPESICICGCKRKMSKLDRAPKMRDSVPMRSWYSFFGDFYFCFFGSLCDIFLVISSNGCFPSLAIPRLFLLCLS